MQEKWILLLVWLQVSQYSVWRCFHPLSSWKNSSKLFVMKLNEVVSFFRKKNFYFFDVRNKWKDFFSWVFPHSLTFVVTHYTFLSMWIFGTIIFPLRRERETENWEWDWRWVLVGARGTRMIFFSSFPGSHRKKIFSADVLPPWRARE